MPLIVHSTCRAPFSTADSELATAIPKSSWQWAERMTPLSRMTGSLRTR